MSSNRLIYDTCAYKKELDQSVGPLSYVLNPIKYENCNKCRMELGIVGGSQVSQIKVGAPDGSLVGCCVGASVRSVACWTWPCVRASR